MKFERLVLKNFGKFQDKEIVLKDGINICYGIIYNLQNISILIEPCFLKYNIRIMVSSQN